MDTHHGIEHNLSPKSSETVLGVGIAGRLARKFIDSKLTPLLMVASLILGAGAILMTAREEEPQIIVPIVDVFVGLPGSAPAEVERLLTMPLEKRLYEIPGVEYVYSTSRSGGALVTVRFHVGDDPERSLVRVYDKLASGLDQAPPGATPPLIKVRSIDDVPVLVLSLSSSRYSAAELRRLAGELRAELTPLEGVSSAKLIGGEKRQVRIELDTRKLAAAGVDPLGLMQTLEAQNASSPAGSFELDRRQILVETGGFLENAEEVAAVVVGVSNGRPIRLRDVATVSDSSEEASTYVYLGRGGEKNDSAFEPAVTLAIAKRQGLDAHEVVSRIRQRIEELRPRLLPPDVELTFTRDYGATASAKADELLLHLGIAVLSVTLMLALALGWRGAVVVLVSVPISFALTLLVYYLFGYTLNRVTLFALVFVTGIVVDDSIIVVENMVRHLSRRKVSPLRAAIEAIDEVGNPTILATWTVIASLMPMALVRGLMGPYMRPMPVGASLAMVFSLLVALVAAPYLGFRLLKATGHASEEESAHSRFHELYRQLLRKLLDSPPARWAFLGSVVVLLVLSILMVPTKLVTVKMLPFDDKNEMQVIVDMPEGTTLERTSEVARELAEMARRENEVEDVTVYVGASSPINFNGLVRYYDLRQGPNVADVSIRFVDKDERSAQSHDLARRLRPAVEEIGRKFGASLKIAEVPPGPPVMSTMVAEVYGPTDEARQKTASEVLELFRSTPGVVDVDWMVEDAQKKMVFRIDHEKAALFGIAPAQAVAALRLAVSGADAGYLHIEGELEPLPLHLTLPLGERSRLQELGALELRSASGAGVPLSEIVKLEETTGATSRFRKNLRPVVYVVGDVAGEQESPVYAILDLAEKVDTLQGPNGEKVAQLYHGSPTSTENTTVKWDGEWQITYEVFRDLGLAFAGVLLLIYFLIVGWFHSFRVPLVMMIAIPLSLIGILPAHWLFGAFFTATSMIGFIALAGIMVRNSVLLIDFVDLDLEKGASLREAVLEAGAVRLRPILLTAGAVAVGSFVILFDPIFQGLAISLLAGSVASTLLTLVVVPVVHYMMERPR